MNYSTKPFDTIQIMRDKTRGIPLFSLIKEHGASKVMLVVICLFCFGVFSAFILGGFTDILTQWCQNSFPHLACDRTWVLVGTMAAVGVSIFGPLLTFHWLLNRSFVFLVITLVAILIAIILGNSFLKNRYERMAKT